MNIKVSWEVLTFYITGVLCKGIHSSKVLLKQNGRDFIDPSLCSQHVDCEPIHNRTCFGTVLPYSYTSVALADDSISQLDVQDNLALWKGLQSVPRCWAVVQPLLCAVYMPKCENNSLSLPSREMCRITRGPCRAVEMKHAWPPFLRCENKKLFPPGCRNPLQEVKFNTSAQCVSPLIETNNSENWYEGAEGCGIQCQNPFYTSREHNRVHKFISVVASICFLLTSFTVVTFIVSWKAANQYPTVIIFYINFCLSISSFGWLIQFFPGAREEIVCLHDGTMRRRQPRSGMCSITFVLIYSFLMAALVWFVILTYAWHMLFRQSGGAPKDIVKKKVAYFHLSAWCIPLVLTTTVMAIKEVDGDSLTGICFVGFVNHVMRISFLLVPVAVASLLGGFFLIGGLYTLIKVKLSSQDVGSGNAKARIRHMIIRIGVFAGFSLMIVICTFACHIYEFTNKTDWEESLREYIVCHASAIAAASYQSDSDDLKCTLRNKPNVTVIEIHLMSLFGFGIVMSSWMWTKATLMAWRRFFNGLCKQPENNQSALKKHKLIAKAFAHRQEINQGHLSFSLNSTHDDPVGMNLEVNSAASQEISSSWAAALPQFLSRRGAIVGAPPFPIRQYSSASDISRHISLDSYCGRQQNLDSLSLQMSEKEFVAHALRHQRRKTRKERERFLRANRIAPWFPGSRRGSDTSIQSSIIAASVVAAAAARQNANAMGKVTKATSTGDLQVDALLQRPSSSFVVTRPLIQRQMLPNPPFTHGMTDNSHCFNSNKRQAPETGYITSNQNCSTGINVNSVNAQAPFGGLHPLYAQSLMQQMQLGYFGGMMYPSANGALFPGYIPNAGVPGNIECGTYGGLSYIPYAPYPTAEALLHQYHQQTFPVSAVPDSASETEYLPIILSDSEFTDTGHRSYDEAVQLLSAQRLLQDHSQQTQQSSLPQQLASHQSPTVHQLLTPSQLMTFNEHSKPSLELQQNSKLQSVPRVGSAGSATSKTSNLPETNSRAQSGRKSPHSEAPPPSPAESLGSLRGEEGDLRETQALLNECQHMAEVPSCQHGNDESQQVKPLIKRTASLSPIQLLNLENVELPENSGHNALGRTSRSRSERLSRNNNSSRIYYPYSNSEECVKPLKENGIFTSHEAFDHISR